MERAELARCLGAEPRVAEACDRVVDEREPERFQAALAEAVAAGGTVFLADPGWGQRERAQFAAICSRRPLGEDTADRRGWLCVPTGGSSGEVKLARHDEVTVTAAVEGFARHFNLNRVNVVGVLPLHHVSGLMAWMRAALTGGHYLPWTSRRLLAGERPELVADGEWFLSLVPTQLQRLLGDAAAEAWLRRFRAVFVGGGPVWPELVERAAAAALPLSFTYGSTETAAMVTALRPEEFLAGGRGCGSALPHARVDIGADGAVAVEGASVFLGYWPDRREPGAWAMGDRARWDDRGSLRVLGRVDGLINTGGEKVDPIEVEAVLRTADEFEDVAVVGVPDPEWGEAVVACYPGGGRAPRLDRVAVVLERELAPWKRPKRFVAVAPWPRNEQGKVNRGALRERVRVREG